MMPVRCVILTVESDRGLDYGPYSFLYSSPPFLPWAEHTCLTLEGNGRDRSTSHPFPFELIAGLQWRRAKQDKQNTLRLGENIYIVAGVQN